MDIRIANDNDLKLIAEMTRQLFEDEPSDMVLSDKQFYDRLQKYIDDGCNAFIFIDEDIVGYALINIMRNPYYLIDFFISRPFRRGGKGTEAFNLLMKTLDTERIDLDVFCWNERGRRFWESLGFKERAIIMSKQ